jgi:FtsH-binding integral membrane protein
MSDRDDDFAVAARTRIDARNRGRERKAARRSRREQILLWLCAPLLFPAAGAAAATAVIEAEASPTVPLFLAALAVPAALTVWLARRRRWLEAVGWALITVAAEVALVFWVGLVALGYGPE